MWVTTMTKVEQPTDLDALVEEVADMARMDSYHAGECSCLTCRLGAALRTLRTALAEREADRDRLDWLDGMKDASVEWDNAWRVDDGLSPEIAPGIYKTYAGETIRAAIDAAREALARREPGGGE